MSEIANPSSPLIQLRAVHVSLAGGAGPVHILRGVDLDIAAGEAVGLVGPSGSGKSTLLSVIGGLEAPSAGSVRVGGREFAGLGEDALALARRESIGIVFQSFHLIPTMTALENVAVPLELSSDRAAFEKAKAELADVGLAPRIHHYPGQLSGGEQQRVALARALVRGPKILLADEPTGNLDGATGAAIIDLIFALKEKRGATLLLITHDEALARRCGRVIRLKDGAIESDGPGDDAAS